MLDLDLFKKINDTYGHQAGDYILKMVCTTILNVIRSHDIAGRYGGEEFAIILPDTNVENALIVAEKIRIAIESLDLVYEGNRIRVTISSGISSLSQCEECTDDPDTKINNISEIIDMADIALYSAKSGKCSSCEFTLARNKTDSGTNCPSCGSTIVPGRNRVEVYNFNMKQFNNN